MTMPIGEIIDSQEKKKEPLTMIISIKKSGLLLQKPSYVRMDAIF